MLFLLYNICMEKYQPFLNLNETGYKPWIKTPEGHPEFLVKENLYTTTAGELRNRPFFPDITNYSYEEVIEGKDRLFEKLNELKLAFQELNQFGINTPFFEYVIGYDQNQDPNIYLVWEKVEGTDLGTGTSERRICKFNPEFLKTAEQFEMIDDLFSKIIKYFIAKVHADGMVLRDIYRPEQYVFGKTKKDEKPQVYLVDIDPMITDMSNYDSVLGFCSFVGWHNLTASIRNFIDQTNFYPLKTLQAYKELIDSFGWKWVDFDYRFGKYEGDEWSEDVEIQKEKTLFKTIVKNDVGYLFFSNWSERLAEANDHINALEESINRENIYDIVDIVYHLAKNKCLGDPKLIKKCLKYGRFSFEKIKALDAGKTRKFAEEVKKDAKYQIGRLQEVFL